MTARDYVVNHQGFHGIGITGKLALLTLIALSSIALQKPVQSSQAVLGEISINGTLMKVEELANTLQCCMGSGAKKGLILTVSMLDFSIVPSDLMGAFQLIPYLSDENVVFKALLIFSGPDDKNRINAFLWCSFLPFIAALANPWSRFGGGRFAPPFTGASRAYHRCR